MVLDRSLQPGEQVNDVAAGLGLHVLVYGGRDAPAAPLGP